MNTNSLDIPYEELAAYCRENQIEYLALFGSAVRDELRADSDVDLLIEFDAAARIGFMALERACSVSLAPSFGAGSILCHVRD